MEKERKRKKKKPVPGLFFFPIQNEKSSKSHGEMYVFMAYFPSLLNIKISMRKFLLDLSDSTPKVWVPPLISWTLNPIPRRPYRIWPRLLLLIPSFTLPQPHRPAGYLWHLTDMLLRHALGHSYLLSLLPRMLIPLEFFPCLNLSKCPSRPL